MIQEFAQANTPFCCDHIVDEGREFSWNVIYRLILGSQNGLWLILLTSKHTTTKVGSNPLKLQREVILQTTYSCISNVSCCLDLPINYIYSVTFLKLILIFFFIIAVSNKTLVSIKAVWILFWEQIWALFGSSLSVMPKRNKNRQDIIVQ